MKYLALILVALLCCSYTLEDTTFIEASVQILNGDKIKDTQTLKIGYNLRDENIRIKPYICYQKSTVKLWRYKASGYEYHGIFAPTWHDEEEMDQYISIGSTGIGVDITFEF